MLKIVAGKIREKGFDLKETILESGALSTLLLNKLPREIIYPIISCYLIFEPYYLITPDYCALWLSYFYRQFYSIDTRTFVAFCVLEYMLLIVFDKDIILNGIFTNERESIIARK